MYYSQNLVLDGLTGNPVNYVGLTKGDFNFLKNVKNMVDLKKNKNIIEKDEEEKNKKQKIKEHYIKYFVLHTYKGVSCLKVSTLLPFLKKNKINTVVNASYYINGSYFISLTKFINIAQDVLKKKELKDIFLLAA